MNIETFARNRLRVLRETILVLYRVHRVWLLPESKINQLYQVENNFLIPVNIYRLVFIKRTLNFSVETWNISKSMTVLISQVA